MLSIDVRAASLAEGVLEIPLHFHNCDDQAVGGVVRRAGGGETLGCQHHLPVMI